MNGWMDYTSIIIVFKRQLFSELRKILKALHLSILRDACDWQLSKYQGYNIITHRRHRTIMCVVQQNITFTIYTVDSTYLHC